MHMLDCLWGTVSVRNRTKAIFTPKLRQTVRKRTTIVLDVRRPSGDPVWACPTRTRLSGFVHDFGPPLLPMRFPRPILGGAADIKAFDTEIFIFRTRFPLSSGYTPTQHSNYA